MTEHIGLREAMKIIDGNENPSDLLNDPRLLQFIDDIESSAVDVLKDKDSEYLSGAVSFLQASVIAVMLEQSGGDMMKMLQALQLVNSKSFQSVVAIVFKMSVGLSIIEELR